MTTASESATAREAADPGDAFATSPMMAQYLALRQEAGDCLLFFRMGDFFELFFDDARKAAEALDIALTQRGKHQGQDIPMCGVPVHAVDGYLARLIRKGFRVAIAEQVEDPAVARKRGSKAVVARAIVRLVTPGTLSEDGLLDARANNMLAGVAQVAGALALAWTDMSTGALGVAMVTPQTLEAELARLDPAEIIASPALQTLAPLAARASLCTAVDRDLSDSTTASARLEAVLGSRAGLSDCSAAELAALGLVAGYLALTQKGAQVHLAPPERAGETPAMLIDAATRLSLELAASQSGERDHTLLGAIDRTLTGAGARLLRTRLGAPLTDPVAINARLDWVGWLAEDALLRTRLRQALRAMPDAERALGRLAVGRGGPRDLAMVRDALDCSAALAGQLDAACAQQIDPPPVVRATRVRFGAHGALADMLGRALVERPPLALADGGVMAAGYDAALDELRQLAGDGRRHLAALEARYREETGIAALKIRHNAVIGYHVEVPSRHGEALAAAGAHSPFIHRQTMANAMRFTTEVLAELAGRIEQAGARALAREQDLFDALRQTVLAEHDAIAVTLAAGAEVDVAAGLADLAAQQGWSRPLVDASCAFRIEGGRHPVVEAALAREGQPFIANSCALDPEERLWLVTGPNMAGKSTFLRQNALIAVLAQSGCFVPAARAHIGVVDRLFSRVGAADDLARGRSTFMVEMVETAAILTQAGERALVILDEVGRGTATWDGLSIAWAALEHLHDVNRCRCLFATHYHELTRLADRLPALRLHTVKVRLWQDALVFLHEIAPGAADRSYGLQVARLAGLPDAVIARAHTVLERLERAGGAGSGGGTAVLDGLPLFAAAAPVPASPPADPLRAALAACYPDELTPRDALDLIYAWKAMLNPTEQP